MIDRKEEKKEGRKTEKTEKKRGYSVLKCAA